VCDTIFSCGFAANFPAFIKVKHRDFVVLWSKKYMLLWFFLCSFITSIGDEIVNVIYLSLQFTMNDHPLQEATFMLAVDIYETFVYNSILFTRHRPLRIEVPSRTLPQTQDSVKTWVLSFSCPPATSQNQQERFRIKFGWL